MRHYFRAIVVVLGLVAVLAGCRAENMQKWTLNSPAVGPAANPEYAIILATKEANLRTLGLISQKASISFKIRNPDPNLRSTTRSIYGGYEVKDIFFLESSLQLVAAPPGEYALHSYHISSSVTSYVFGGWKNGPGRALGVFKVEPGEVIYIGHLDFKPDGTTLNMRVEDRFEEFRATLPEHLAAKVQKRLLVVPESLDFPHRSTTTVVR